MDWSRRTRRPAKHHVEKKLPKVHGNYYNRIKVYRKTNTNYKILADNMFRNCFQIYYQRHNIFLPFLYIFTKRRCEYFFDKTISVYFSTRQKEVIPKTKRSLFGIEKFTKQLKEEGKMNCIVLNRSTQKDMDTDEVGVPNEVILLMRNHHKCFSLIN